MEMSLSAVIFGVKDSFLITISKWKLVKIDFDNNGMDKKCYKYAGELTGVFWDLVEFDIILCWQNLSQTEKPFVTFDSDKVDFVFVAYCICTAI